MSVALSIIRSTLLTKKREKVFFELLSHYVTAPLSQSGAPKITLCCYISSTII